MKPVAKILYLCWAIKFIRYSNVREEIGIFRFRYWNPLTWLFGVILFICMFIASIFDVFEKTFEILNQDIPIINKTK